MDELPASPAQLAPNPKGGTDAIEGDVAAREAFAEALERLLAQIDFALAGYAEMVPRARPEVDRLLLDWRTMHLAHRDALSLLAIRWGESPRGGSRWAAWLQRAIIRTRAALTGIGPGVLGPVVMGEERTIDLYDDAVAAAADPEARDLLAEQRAALIVLHNRTRDLT
ncbi:hypothetical protein JQC91_14435 [Jannaschia sp. Os4]|uniref:hypothetical protein n=1 Tax=Jannaschia sp. Os4 TaxID=2807617 RepID=UPI0019395BB6|nr:hypothetical protein [Jannaschia sp. Os4]MBM2577502.1 hypothetical protein [Jannaschia sp. Os4]